MKRRISLIVLTLAILIPFLVNLLGWSIYAYFNFGANDLIFASSIGVSHLAWAEHYEEDATFGMTLPNDFKTTILDAGFLNLFLERRGDSMTPFTFRWIEANEYSNYTGFEFPWLLLLFIPFMFIALQKMKRRQNKKACVATGDDVPS